MKTRIIYTDFWVSSSMDNLSSNAKYLYIFLITNSYIGMSGVYRLPDEYIAYETKLTQKELDQVKKELTNKNKARFCNGWVYVVNAEKHNNYRNSPKNRTSYFNEVKSVPKDVFDKLLCNADNSKILVSTTPDTSIDTSIYNSKILVSTTPDTSHKSEIINHKSEIRNSGLEKNTSTLESEAPF